MRRRKLGLTAMLMVVAVIAAGCTGGGNGSTEVESPTEGQQDPADAAEEGPDEGEQVALRFMYHAASPGNDDAVLTELVDRFMDENPNITVELDFVGREVLDQTLPLRLEQGEAPDIARMLIPLGFEHRDHFLDLRPHLEDTAYWDENLGEANEFFSGGSGALHGFHTDVTVTGPYINRTLFEQAGVDVPSDASDEVTWEEWEAAATEVRDATGVPHAIIMDPSGHRFAGPALSKGATFFDGSGEPQLAGDEGLRNMLQLLVDWHESGVMPLEIWGGAQGASLDAAGEFINGNAPMYMSGSWQVGRFESEISDAFDYEVVPNPCGDGGCTGMPGGGFLTGFADTEHPEEVAQLMDFLASEEIYREFAERTLLLPGHEGFAEAGLDFQTETQAGADALSAWLTAEVSPEAQNLVASPYGDTIFGVFGARISQTVVGELTVDQALEAMQQDVEDAIASAG